MPDPAWSQIIVLTDLTFVGKIRLTLSWCSLPYRYHLRVLISPAKAENAALSNEGLGIFVGYFERRQQFAGNPCSLLGQAGKH